MAAIRTPALRHLLSNRPPCLRLVQRRWAQVHDVRFVATQQIPARIVEKYKQKLEKKLKETGAKDIDELKRVFKDKEKTAASSVQSPLRAPTSPFPPPPPPPRIPFDADPHLSSAVAASKSSSPPGVKTLASFIDVPKTLALPQKEIEYIWRLRHASSPQSLCATIPQTIYSRLEATARQHPQFILPLPREGQGAEIHFLQWTFPTPDTTTVLFTHLAEYKLRGEYSTPHTTVTHHLELAGPKGLVLLQGAVTEGRGVSVEEGKWLLMCLQKFYGGVGETAEGGTRRKLLEMFARGDENFRIEELVDEAEKIV